MTRDAALTVYAALASRFSAPNEAMSADAQIQGLVDLPPDRPAQVMGVGPGRGQNSAWFVACGDAATAAGPANFLRKRTSVRAPKATRDAAPASEARLAAAGISWISLFVQQEATP